MESSSVAAAAAGAGRRRKLLTGRAWLGPGVYVVALGLAIGLRGLPTSRDALMFWLLLGMLAASLTNLRRWFRGLLVDWLPFLAVLFAYDLLRGYADRLFSAHVWPQLRFDEVLFGTAPTVWLQQRLWDPKHIDWIDYAAWSVYLTHFFATLVIAACLWVAASPLFRRYMASRDGHLAPTDRIVAFVSDDAPVNFFGSLWEHGSRYANDVAAMPSLHAAYALLIALVFWRVVQPRWRPLLALYPLAMAFALVYTAEHYVSDVLVGWLYACLAFLAVEAIARRRAPARA
jgi:membrane-associated phospholipid phosphatase